MNIQRIIQSLGRRVGVNGNPRDHFLKQYLFLPLANVAVFVFLSVSIQSCDKDIAFDSTWRQLEITVDGSDREWQDHVTNFDDEAVAVGIQNDATDLYLLLKTTDNPTKQRLMRTGFTIWFNADGEKEKTFGIRYPIGLMAYQQTRPYDPKEWRGSPEERLKKQIPDMLTEIEIIGPGENEQDRISTNNPFGIAVGLTDTTAALIYELKVPLVASGDLSYQIGAEPGSTIRTGLETSGMEGKQVIRRSGSGSGGMGGQGGRIRKGDGPPGSGARRIGPAEPMEIWLELRLAAKTGMIQVKHKNQ